MSRIGPAIAVFLLAVALLPGSADAQSGRVQAGILDCDISGGIGFIIGSRKEVTCAFLPAGGGPREMYVGSISKFGLLELSRQRLRPALSEGSHITCPRCNGTGHIRDTESSALQILRMVQEEAMKDNTAAVHVQVPVEVTSFLLNEKRTEITKIELKQRVTVLLVPNKHLETPNYRLERLRQDDPRLDALFERLQETRSPLEARMVEQQIWEVWLESGNPAVDRLMAQGILAMQEEHYDVALRAFDRMVE